MSIKTIAEATGYSLSTVSRVLNKPGYKCASAEMRENILKAAREQGYIPNESARNLKLGTDVKKNIYYINVIVTRAESAKSDPYLYLTADFEGTRGAGADQLRYGALYMATDQIVFASSYPLGPIAQGIQSVKDWKLPAEIEQKILYDNAAKILGKTGGVHSRHTYRRDYRYQCSGGAASKGKGRSDRSWKSGFEGFRMGRTLLRCNRIKFSLDKCAFRNYHIF